MNMFDELASKFKADEPILVEDIERLYPDRSRPWIDKAIRTMIDNKQIKRFSTGVYYIPRKTILGDSVLNPRKVIVKKYIQDSQEVYGYLGGASLLNSFGLTTQVPNVITVISNNESTRGRKIEIGNQSVYLCKPPTTITKSNFKTLQFCELIRLIDFDTLDSIEIKNLENYIDENNISLSGISKYCSAFPDSVSRKILGGPLIEKLTQ
ncbi:MAG: DUF6088 family protein [Eubacterium sp.]